MSSRVEESAAAMGTVFSIVAYGPDSVSCRASIYACFDEVRRIETVLSPHLPESEWAGINRNAAFQPFRVSQESFDLLTECVQFSQATQGAFDITVGPLLELWSHGRLPGERAISEARHRVGAKHLLLDPAARTVKFAVEHMSIHPGGIGKGYAVDRLVAILRRQGISKALVSAGGSSIFALGGDWPVDVPDPVNPRRIARQVLLRSESISTSGTWERFFWSGGRMYSHIVDPRTGQVVQGTVAASVIAPRAVQSEVWAKAQILNGG